MENEIQYYRAKVYLFTLQFIKNKNLAEDLTQDIMVKVWLNYEKLSRVEDLDNYVLKMAKNHVIDHFKKLAREKAYQSEVWFYMQKIANGAEDKLMEKETYCHLDSVIKNLPLRQQEVYALNKKEGLSLHEVAATLGITIRTARNHLDRALKTIRNNIKKSSFWLFL